MTIFQALKKGFGQTWRFQRIVWILYGLTFLLAAFVALPFRSYLESKVGHSLVVGDMVKGFDYTVINDFLNAYGAGINPILSQSLLMLVLYLLLLVFLMGGIISVFRQNDWQVFWQKSGAFFWRMLRLTLYFLVLHAVILGAFLWLFLFFTKGFDFTALKSDRIIFSALNILPLIYIPVAALFFMWQDYSKIILVKRDSAWLYQPILKAFRFMIQNFRSAYGLYLLNMILLGIVFFLNYWLTTAFQINSTITIWLSFLISQLFVVIRLSLKLVNLSSANALYSKR